jgi:hypothetical protein
MYETALKEEGGCEGITAIAGEEEGLKQNGIETRPSLLCGSQHLCSAVAFPSEAFSLLIVQSFPLTCVIVRILQKVRRLGAKV